MILTSFSIISFCAGLTILVYVLLQVLCFTFLQFVSKSDMFLDHVDYFSLICLCLSDPITSQHFSCDENVFSVWNQLTILWSSHGHLALFPPMNITLRQRFHHDVLYLGTMLDEEVRQMMLGRRASSSDLRSVGKLIKYCDKHKKEVGLFCRKCRTPVCLVSLPFPLFIFI